MPIHVRTQHGGRVEFLRILDPEQVLICMICAGDKEQNTVVCANCAECCPDPHCRNDGTKAPTETMCQSCRIFLNGLPERRYYVYICGDGYIGMSSDLESRQSNHIYDAVLDEARDNPAIRYPRRYAEVVSEDPSEKIEEWLQDPENSPNPLIVWCSPRLNREEAYRCEWALKRSRQNDRMGERLLTVYENAVRAGSEIEITDDPYC